MATCPLVRLAFNDTHIIILVCAGLGPAQLRDERHRLQPGCLPKERFPTTGTSARPAKMPQYVAMGKCLARTARYLAFSAVVNVVIAEGTRASDRKGWCCAQRGAGKEDRRRRGTRGQGGGGGRELG